MLITKLWMGGYGVYVWSAYGITLTTFALNVLLALKEKNAARKRIQHWASAQVS